MNVNVNESATTLLYDVDEILTKVGSTKQYIAKVKKGYVVNSVSGIETLTDRDLATMIAVGTMHGHNIDGTFEHDFSKVHIRWNPIRQYNRSLLILIIVIVV